MPEQTQYFYNNPLRVDIYNRLKRIGDPQVAFELFRRAMQPQISAGQRRIRNLSAGFGGGVGLGEETKYLAETNAGISAEAIQGSINALQAAGSQVPQYSKVTTKTKTSPLDTIMQVAPTVARTAVGGIVGGPAGALAGLGGYNLPLSLGDGEEGGLAAELKQLGISEDEFADLIRQFMLGK